jgi:hypothetical protein
MDEIVQYCGQPMRVACDEKCIKAWGIDKRPRWQCTNKPDDWAYFADGDLDNAPENPGTYEGGNGKPKQGDTIPNKWCVRQCERCAKSSPGKSGEPLALNDFSNDVFNIKR